MLKISKSGDLLRPVFSRACKYSAGRFVRGKTAAADLLVRRSRSQLPLLPSPLWQIALWIAPQKNTLTGSVFIRTGQGFF